MIDQNDPRIRRLAAAYQAKLEAEHIIAKTLNELKGADVRWLRQKHQERYAQHGRVVEASFSQVKVRNDRTGKEPWISVYDLLEGVDLIDEGDRQVYLERTMFEAQAAQKKAYEAFRAQGTPHGDQ
jgi:hypothetical protein